VRNSLRLLLVIFRLVIALSLTSPVFASEIKDYGIEVGGVESMLWIDNDRLALRGLIHTPDRQITTYSAQRTAKLVILDTRSGKADWHEEFSGQFCYDGEKFKVSSTDDIFFPETTTHEYHFWILRGVPGKLQRKEVSREYLNTFDFMMACKAKDERPLPAFLEAAKKSGRLFRALKPEHGWLEMQKENERFLTYPKAIYPAGKKEQPIPIDPKSFEPWISQDISVRLLRHEAFKDAYLLALDDIGSGRTNGGYWWLYPDGRVEQILLYTREKTSVQGGSYANGIPAKNAFLRVSVDDYPEDKSGLYLRRQDGSFEKLLKGWASEGSFAVSPNGCKVAFGIDPRGFLVKGPRQYRLHLINVCERNSK